MHEGEADRMKHFRVIYRKIDTREVWIEVNDTTNENEVEEIFVRNFEHYDDESDDHDNDGGSMDILTIDKINEDGEAI
jgi:hypothetical protein